MTLSSCYFCGTAIEEPLSEYPVVPDALAPAPDDQVTVVLCPSCHRKLSTVLDRVVAAADTRQRTLDGASTAPSDDGADGDEASDDGTAADDRPSIDEGAAADLLGDDPLAADDPDGDAASDDADGADPSADAGTTSDAESSGGAAGSSGGITVDDGPGSETDDGDDAVTVDAGGTSTGDADDPAGGTGDAAGGGAASEKASPASAGDAPSQATYNRVVRLLQNREFPVERDEIATVAMNAYDIPPEDFDAVIQTAVNRGVLAEEGQYLEKPE